MQVKIFTSKGNMLIDLYETEAPNTVANFTKLIRKGYYDGLTFHRVIPNFVIQGGCPNGTGSGGPGYTIDCELNGGKQKHERGVLSMAHAGRNTGGSQFFICHSSPSHLNGNHTCFGKVVPADHNVIDQIAPNDVIDKIEII